MKKFDFGKYFSMFDFKTLMSNDNFAIECNQIHRTCNDCFGLK